MFGKKRNLIFIILIVVGVTIFFIIRGGSGKVSTFRVDNEADAFVLTSPDGYTFSIPVSGIESTELIKLEDPGECLEDHSGKKYTCGTFRSESLGTYKACYITKVSSVIVARCSEDDVYVFNYEGERSTSELYRAIREYVNRQ